MDTYEKKYNEAIKYLKAFIDGDCVTDSEILADFPELRESEDERIRKVIYKLMLGMREEIFTSQDEIVTKEKVLAYLEKQKEIDSTPLDWNDYKDKPVEVWNAYISGKAVGIEIEKQKKLFESGKGLYYYDGEKATYCGYPATEENPYDFAISQQEKQKEQKPISQEDFDTAKHEALWEEQKPTEYLDKDKVYAVMQKLHKLAFSQLIPINSDEYKKIDEITCDIRNFLNYPIEQKPLEKQDYSGLNDLERAIHRGFLVAGVESVPVTVIKETAKECLALKPVEWLEEDEIYLQDALWCVEQATKVARDENDMGACWSAERWLKSLRPHWKPSEEQMEALAYASKVLSSALYPVAAKASEELESIREQLKKL